MPDSGVVEHRVVRVLLCLVHRACLNDDTGMVLRQAVQLAAAVPRPVPFSLLMTASHCSPMRSEARLIITCCGAGRAGRSNISSDSELSSRSTSRSPIPPPLRDPSPARIANEALKNSNLPAQVGPQVLQQNALHDVAAVAMHEWACGMGGELCLRVCT